jgi:hypothetical protein
MCKEGYVNNVFSFSEGCQECPSTSVSVLQVQDDATLAKWDHLLFHSVSKYSAPLLSVDNLQVAALAFFFLVLVAVGMRIIYLSEKRTLVGFWVPEPQPQVSQEHEHRAVMHQYCI